MLTYWKLLVSFMRKPSHQRAAVTSQSKIWTRETVNLYNGYYPGHTLPADRKVCRFFTNWGFRPDLFCSGWDWLQWLVTESASLLDNIPLELISALPNPPLTPTTQQKPTVHMSFLRLSPCDRYQGSDQCAPSRQWVIGHTVSSQFSLWLGEGWSQMLELYQSFDLTDNCGDQSLAEIP